MRALEMIQAIYTRPSAAFDTDQLEQSYRESLAWYLGLGAAGTLLSMLSAHSGVAVPASLALLGLAVGVGEVVLTAYFTRVLIERQGQPFALRPLLAGLFWISVALAPIQIAATLIGLPWVGWLTMAVSVYFAVLCVQQLSRLSRQLSAKFLISSFVGSLILGTVCVVVVGTFLQAASRIELAAKASGSQASQMTAASDQATAAEKEPAAP
jgi:hypothetical protein